MSGWGPADLLPAVWLVLVSVAIHLAARRWAAPIPLAVWALAAALLLVLFGPSLLLGRILFSASKLASFPPFEELLLGSPGNRLHGDIVLQIVPMQSVVRRLLAAGEWPLWNSWVGAGVPLLANPQAQVLQPLVWLTLPLPLAPSLGVVASLRVLVAYLSTFLLLRYQGAGRAAALFGAVAYALGAFVLLWAPWPLASSAALLPLAVYGTVRFMAERDRRTWALLALATAAVLAAGHPDTVLWVLTVAGLFALSSLLLRRRSGGEPGRPVDLRAAARGVAGWASAVAVAAALTAPVVLTAAHQAPRSQRYALMEARAERLERTFSQPERWSLDRVAADLAESGWRVVPVVAPNAFGNQRFGPFWGDRNVNGASGGFAGSATLLAAVLAMLSLVRGRGPRIAGEPLAAALVLLSLVLRAQPPGLLALMTQIPGIEHSAAFHRRSHMVLVLGLAYIAAGTVERWRRGAFRPRTTVAAAVGLALLVTWGYLAHPHPRAPETLSGLRHGSLALHLGVLGVACALLAFRRLGRGRWAAVALVGVQAAELLVLHAPAHPSAPAASFYPRTPALDFLMERAGTDRVAALGSVLRSNTPSVYGLADVRSNDPFKPWDMQRLLDPVLHRTPGGGFPIADAMKTGDHPVLDLLGVRYVLTASDRPRPPPPLEPVLRGETVVVWARPEPLDRLFLPAEAVTPGQAARGRRGAGPGPWWRWTATNPDFAARTLVEPSPGHRGSWRAERPSGAVLEVESRGPDRWRARALLPEERLLASGIYQDGGWRVLVDGRAIPTVIANGPLLAAWLPAGEHRVDLVYRPPGFVAGCLLAALALAILAAAAVRPPAVGLRWRCSSAGTDPASPARVNGCP